MTEEEIKQKFAEAYPDFVFCGLPLSPYFDIWCYAIEIMEQENNKLLDVINNQDVKIADLEKENKTLEGCLFAEQEYTQMLEKQIEKMKCCSNCNHFNKEEDIEHCWNCERQLVNSLDNLSREEIIKDEWEIKEND